MKRLVLIDGNAIFHRGYHALPGLTNSRGVPTSGVFGFAAMTLKMLPELKPDLVIVAWDKAKTSIAPRVALYPEYKAKRKVQPDDFYEQIPYLRRYIDAMHWPFIELDNYEADDIIGALARQAERSGFETIIATGDLDTLQLVDDQTKVYASRRGLTDVVVFDRTMVKEKYGLTPEQWLDYKAIRGDASDNIPGIPGIGEKGALDLLTKYGTLEGIYKHLDDIPGKLGQKLREGREMADLSKRLATIATDAPVVLDQYLTEQEIDAGAVSALFKELDFKSLENKIPATAPRAEVTRKHLDAAKYEVISDKIALTKLGAKLKGAKVVAVDTETEDLDPHNAALCGISLAVSSGEAYYINIAHAGSKLSLDEAVAALKPLLENPKIGKVGHNIKYDYQVLMRHGITITPIAFDTMVAAFLLNPLGRTQSLTDLAYKEFGIEMIPITELIGEKPKEQIKFNAVEAQTAGVYAAEDADITYRLYEKYAKLLKAEKLSELAEAVEWPLIPVLAEMEKNGIEIDVSFLAKFSRELEAKLNELEATIYQHAEGEFNINSPAQLGQVLYEKLKIVVPGVKRGKTGALSTAAKELEKMRGYHPIIEHIFEYRELTKLKSTYVDALPNLVAPDGRVHTSFNQTIAQTGRLSSTNPNLQNIPIRGEVGRKIRRAFVAPRGRVLVAADYSQFELRIAAALAKDEGMIRAFREGSDIHVETAAELFGKKREEVTKDDRAAAKTVNFGVLYGMSAHGLAVSTGMEQREAAEFIKKYYELRPQLRIYLDRVIADTKTSGYSATLFGRRRPLPEINSNNFVVASQAERMAINVPIQGTQADIMKLAMIKVQVALDDRTKMLLQIHDELIVETDTDAARQVGAIIKKIMEATYDIGVPIEVNVSAGKNWGELEDLK